MTSFAHAVAAAANHPQITLMHCLTISCAVCSFDAWDAYVMHFDTEEALWDTVFADGWTARRDGRVLCPRHSDADCAEQGHRWDDWYWLPSDPQIEYRYCDHCSVGEERPTLPSGDL